MDEEEARRAVKMHEGGRSPEEIAERLGVEVGEIDRVLDLCVVKVFHALARGKK